MGFFSFSSKPTPKDVAKDRLKLILIHDRGEIEPEIIDNRTDVQHLESHGFDKKSSFRNMKWLFVIFVFPPVYK